MRPRPAALLALSLAACHPAAPTPAPGAGSLEKDDIRAVVRAHIPDVRECYNRGLARDKNLVGRVDVRFTIGPTGAVSSASVQATTLPFWARFVGRCIARAARRWPFPAPDGGGSVIVSYPFVLEPATRSSPPP